MGKSAVVLIASFSIAACGSPPPSATPASVAAQNVIVPAPPPAPLVDPIGLVTVAPPTTSVCELTGKNDFDVSATADGPALFHLHRGDAKLVIGSQGEVFVSATTPTFTIRGFIAHDPSDEKSLVYAAKWLSFGGVYFPGIHDAMVMSVHDGKISLTARDDRGFHFTGDSGTLDVACDDIGLAPDAKGLLRNSLPPAFETDAGKLSVLKYTKSVSLSADPDGPAAGAFDVKDGPATVSVIERKGKKAHVRTDHFLGWVDASALKPFTPSTRKDKDGVTNIAMLAAIGGVLGEVNAVGGSTDASPTTPVVTSTLVCTADVRILVVTPSSPSPPFAIGTIPAGKPVHLSSRGDDMSMIALDDDPKNPRVSLQAPNRFAAPNKDLASCTALGSGAPPAARSTNDDQEMIAEANGHDAIDELPAETPKKTPHASSPHPRVQQESANAMGVLSLDVVALRLGQILPQYQQCYQRALDRDPMMHGRMTFHFTIDARGAATKLASSADLPDPNLRACIARKVEAVTFPTSGGATDVTYGLGFSAQ